ncbi:LacI family DNA-binding transcriptional regulator [Bacillus haynesii]|uniref:LacI family transcriptional regulator n=1 Tax=Bacillus haynesii TaxID=1925021 RepID=A0AA90EZE9_9BACI|nr:LacI family DNA-binding transcriptional regulator [Bacillus haynesii]MCY7752341.1 LacI family transcriptional regulator [Bacillus haynesii]MCY7769078.1 LacI family transcriptional regulator [Bacillus haynesii]MCY7789508.1 LacI family transcriptional regulator [Bacillus haynesii]MCY7847650.1 LacI family transcriptional regulator [Bacillus haynesii]MCY7862387.1 LacI family transcriptional regulator [Bacillus haynesii]
MPTIDEIAKLSNVSKTTVSRVLNDHPYVSEEKRKRVLEVIEKLDYIPNTSARKLRSNKTMFLAVSVPHADHPFFAQLMKHMSAEALKHQYKVIVFQTFYQKQNELKVLELLKRKEVDGLMLCSLENEWEDIKKYVKYGPVVLANEFHAEADVPVICYDEFEAGYKGTELFIQKGHHLMAFCCDTIHSKAQIMRKEGFMKALSDAGLCFQEKWMFSHAFTIHDGFRIMDQIHNMSEKPTAIFTGNDQVAAGIIKRARYYQYEVPKQLAVLGYDNQSICEVTDPEITTIDIPVEELAQKAVCAMVNLLNGESGLQRDVVTLSPTLKIRQSV